MVESEYFLVVLVNARHLDYSDGTTFIKTLVKHPSDGSKNGDVGHAWIYLQGMIDGQCVFVEGGHSGELGILQPKYFDGVMNYIEYGYANPTSKQMQCFRDEPNPVKYLWASQKDGFFQQGCGNHTPTFAAKIDLTSDQFKQILAFIQPENYHYPDYSLCRNQCSSFVAQVASLADFSLTCEMTMPINSTLTIAGETFTLWKDAQYGTLTFSSPDVIEKSLIQAVNEGRAANALSWYLKKHRHPLNQRISNACDSMTHFPSRVWRALLYSR